MANLGDLLNQRYQIEEVLGQGGFGTVYKARDTQNRNRICAVKENTENDPAARKQFEREASYLRGLRHPSLPQVFDFFLDPNGQQYFVMEFIKGADLKTLVQKHGMLPEDKVLGWMDQICDALIHLHRNNVIHRDIKPANILITPTGKAMLVDVGIAKIYDPNNPLTPTTAGIHRLGTPGFAPIEQIHGGTDGTSDVYAMGATLYFCLTAQTPPESGRRVDPSILAPLVPPRQLNPSISPVMESVIVKALQMSKTDRFQSAQALRAALHAVRQGAQQQVGTINLPRWILKPELFTPGYSPKGYGFVMTTANGATVMCELTGYMFPLTLLQGANVRVEGVPDANSIFQVTRLTDLQTNKTWIPKPMLGWWERLKIDLGLMNP